VIEPTCRVASTFTRRSATPPVGLHRYQGPAGVEASGGRLHESAEVAGFAPDASLAREDETYSLNHIAAETGGRALFNTAAVLNGSATTPLYYWLHRAQRAPTRLPVEVIKRPA
jgi:hypothetical protein